MAPPKLLCKLITLIWGDWQTNELWQRILKDTIANIVATVIAVLPILSSRSTFLIPMVVVFAHPAQRMGVMIETLAMIVLGSVLGVSWSILGLYLANLVIETHSSAAYTIRALFLLAAVLFHGFLRSSSPRLFLFVLFFLIPAIQSIGVPSNTTSSLYGSICVPVIIGASILLVVNLCIFPELSSSYLGSSTIDTLNEVVDTLTRSAHWFITPGADSPETRGKRNNTGATLVGQLSNTPQRQRRQRRVVRRLRKFLSAFPNPFKHAKSKAASFLVPLHLTTLVNLTEKKAQIRSQLSACKTAQDEVNFEVCISALSPLSMRAISTDYMALLVQNTITLIGACENKYIVLGDEYHTDPEERPHSSNDQGQLPQYQEGSSQSLSTSAVEKEVGRSRPVSVAEGVTEKRKKKNIVEDIKLNRELQSSSANLLESVLAHIRGPVQDFQNSLSEAVALLSSCLAYCFDVPKLPSGSPTPGGIPLEEIDLRIDAFTDALDIFDERSSQQLKKVVLHSTGQSLDFMPRMETFLISSFLLAFRQSAVQILHMLRHVRALVEQRQRRNDRLRVWLPHSTGFRKWLSTGGDEDGMVLPKGARKAIRRGDAGQETSSTEHETCCATGEKTDKRNTDEETASGCNTNNEKASEQNKDAMASKQKHKQHKGNWFGALRVKAADGLEWAKDSDDFSYALKLSVAVLLVSWPALVPSWNNWYAQVRGIWAPTQLILIFEVAIGTSSSAILIRILGVIYGCTSGFVAHEVARGYRVGVAAVLVFTMVPAVYVIMATKYAKTGAVAIVSMNVVALGKPVLFLPLTLPHAVCLLRRIASIAGPAPAYDIYYKRLVAFLVGALVGLLVEIILYPVRARDRLVESLSTTVRQIQNMQAAISIGIDGPVKPNFRSHAVEHRYRRARDKAQGALAAAETFFPFCVSEPRLKGSFKTIAPIYNEMIYVLHQIIDRLDNAVQLRKVYGSTILDQLNPQVYAYRRNVAASSAFIMFSVHEALTTWLPLPQFLPSARLAQLRLINRVREVVITQVSEDLSQSGSQQPLGGKSTAHDEQMALLITKRSFLSWNASTAGQMEIIEYMEELTELVKLLVGVNAFRGGILERPTYREYMRQMETNETNLDKIRPVHSTVKTESHRAEQVEEDRQVATQEDEPSAELGLRRTATIAEHVQKITSKLRKGNRGAETAAVEVSNSEDEADEVPVSLQRVGTRLWQDNAAARRRVNASLRGI